MPTLCWAPTHTWSGTTLPGPRTTTCSFRMSSAMVSDSVSHTTGSSVEPLTHSGGNLSSRICHNRAEGVVFSEEELKRLLRHVCLVSQCSCSTSLCGRPLIIPLIQGLQYIHSMGLVHLDVKPDNIFISLKEPHLPVTMDTIMEDKCSEDQDLVYKIGECQPTHSELVSHDTCFH